MILDRLDQWPRYSALHQRFADAFRFLERADLAQIPDGRHEVDGVELYASVDRRDGRGHAGAPPEFHREYIDIQYTVSGVEVIGWKSLAGCRDLTHPYDAKRDIGFYADPPEFWMTLAPGSFAILYPDDVHAPLAGEGPVHKVVMKVRLKSGR